jgi:thermostable 8-oxoguanine DNA glycosylase
MTPGFTSKQLILLEQNGLMEVVKDKNKRFYQTRSELIRILTFSMETFRQAATR